ncbi:MAG: GntR family transcriptional regulator [Nocardioidaceae bacterium]
MDNAGARGSLTGFEPVTRPRVPQKVQLGEEIAAYVRDMIMSGQLRGGEPIHMDVLARELGTSVSPVREALLLLSGEGFVLREARKGFRIASLSRGDIADLYLVQSFVAGELAARAATASGAKLAAEIEGIQQRLDEAGARGDVETVEHFNNQFHRALNGMAQSPKLGWLLGIVVRYVPSRFFATIPGWSDASTYDHEAILKASREGDAEAARAAMASHIVHAGELLVEHLEGVGFWD